MNPGILFPDTDEFQKVRIQPCFLHRLFEERFMGPRCARSNDHPVETVFFDVLLDLGQIVDRA